MSRPVGISILGGLVVLAAAILVLVGIASFFVGLAFLFPGSQISGTTLILNGILYFVLGVVLGVAGIGLLMMRAWAWGLAVLGSLVGLVYLLYGVYQDTRGGGGISLSSAIITVIVGAILVYLLSVSRAFFRKAAVTT
jgi:hypothetical protein